MPRRSVCAGRWEGDLRIERDLRLESVFGAVSTELSGSGESAVVVSTARNLALVGFTINGGGGAVLPDGRRAGGGLSAWDLDGASVVVEQNLAVDGGGVRIGATAAAADKSTVIETNEGTGKGGGVYIDGGSWSGGVLAHNVGWYGGGVALEPGATLAGADIVSNYAEISAGGVYCLGDCELDGLSVRENGASINGGGVRLGGVDSVWTVSSSVITENTAYLYGGGMYVEGGVLHAKEVEVTHNDDEGLHVWGKVRGDGLVAASWGTPPSKGAAGSRSPWAT